MKSLGERRLEEDVCGLLEIGSGKPNQVLVSYRPVDVPEGSGGPEGELWIYIQSTYCLAGVILRLSEGVFWCWRL